ncbi:molybdopterin-dependent oxidoreductase [Hymenobacter taeanensis]|uniref:Molybdopterin-dependent oxidoreductase n=1 Tax=Hymenobacter taeanensis TaxID=2735321 RepID=A0A6M6BI96_9BACT|nr:MULTISPECIES: molybdopterin cofactor-binding domain-containing protein [Hymenobacter]QJX47524.1 molybdopterin-dependent oxidoreductase [Hymenobacter taeanensis]UOQ82992.1 molybdopterin-dependent oxidoreductase [Hymenobacter sp. 5414T-23]
MNHLDPARHVRGESQYLDDILVQQGTLYAAVVESPVAHGKLLNIDFEAALQLPGVVRVLTAQDIPGENQIGGIVPDEPLLAEGHVHFRGQPVALVLAETEHQAHAALGHVRVEVSPLPIITDPRVAAAQNELIVPPRTFQIGDTQAAWAQCAHVFEGVAESGGQEHLYIETQGAYAFPTEMGGVRMVSSTQGPTAVQRHTARVLGIGMHQVEVDVTRLGGGFGGKEDQATTWGALAALGAFVVRRPVKLVLDRMADMRMTGKRHPYSSDFKIGLDKNLKLVAYEATFYQNAGAAADLSPAVLERTLFHATNSYFVPNVTATAYSCRTNLPPNTAFRGFGGPQGMFVIESALTCAAEQLGVPVAELQRRNLLREGDVLPYRQPTEGCHAEQAWDTTASLYNLPSLRAEVEAFNAQNKQFKKGLSVMPICFGISFTKTPMNQARALVHIYTDGSVGVSTGAVEMGQGVNTKIMQVAARTLGISPERVKVESTNTTRVANTSPSAASATADLNGKATEMACLALRERLLRLAATDLQMDYEGLTIEGEQVLAAGTPADTTWEKLVSAAYWQRVSLTENAHYATPGIHFDAQTNQGHPFAYHVYGTALTTVTVDCLRGTYTFDAVQIAHDFGQSLHPQIDRGQIEGGLVQGLGWMTLEELVFNDEGRLLSNSLNSYKIPDLYSAPKVIDVHFLDTPGHPNAIMRSKAVGEPPLMYGIGAYFAVRDAIRSFRPGASLPFSAPITPEKVLLSLYPDALLTPACASTTVTTSVAL